MRPYYQESGITIYHGDCREVLPELHSFDLCLTDPPYGLGARMHSGGTWATDPKYDAMLEWDNALPDSDMLSILSRAMRSIVWGGNLYALPPSRSWLIWKKIPSLPTMADCEFAWTNFDRPAKCFESTRSPDGIHEHPTQKPVSLMNWCLQSADFAKSMIDPFMGSGSSLVAAKRRAITAVGIDREERYCEIAAKRLAQGVLDFTEQPA